MALGVRWWMVQGFLKERLLLSTSSESILDKFFKTMKKVIVDFALECEQYSEIRLTIVTDGFKYRENQDYTYLPIAAKHTVTDNV